MAVYNDYVDSNIRNGRPTSAIAAQGSHYCQWTCGL